jgi:predicted NBD/HSP70 family sugar kinase
MDPTRAIAIVTDMARNVIATSERPIDSVSPASAIVDALIDAARSAIASSAVPDSKIIGLGFAVTGFLNREAGVAVMSSTLPNWRNVPVRFLLQQAFAEHPVLTDDSVTCATLAEKWFGRGVGVRDFISLRVRTGLSIGIVVNGELYRGIGNAGTVNHIYVQPGNAALEHDQPRMLFEMASGHAIIHRLRQSASVNDSPVLWRLIAGDPQRVSLESVVAAAATDDPLCICVLRESARCWARAIARVYELLHPSKAIFCGAFAGLSALRQPLADALQEEIYPALRDQVVLEFSELGPEAAALGAAALVLQQHIYASAAG